MTTKKKITILIPAYNEESVVKPLYQRLKEISQELRKYSFEFLFINDGSKDSTLKIIKTLSNEDNRVSYISLSRNYGKEIAMIAGLDYAKGNDATIIIDADLQDPPELIPDMIKYWEDGYDDVYAQRRSREGESFIKKKTSEWFYKLLQKSTRINIQKDTGDFRLLSKRSVESLTMLRESQRYTKGMFSWIGYKKKKIIYDRSPRLSGKSKWN